MYCKYDHVDLSFTYDLSLGSIETPWSFLPSITLEASDETHTQLFIDGTSGLYYYLLTATIERLIQRFFKHGETHCLSDYASNTRLASETRESLERDRYIEMNRLSKSMSKNKDRLHTT